MPPRRAARFVPAAAGAALVLGVAATAVLAARYEANAAAAVPARVLDVTARDYAFDVADTVPAGRTLVRLHNAGPELHHVILLRIDGGRHLGDLFEAVKAPNAKPPAWVHDVGGPNAPAPGAVSQGAVTLEPGTYAMVCFIPSKDGTPHVMKGMAKEITVVATSRASASRAAFAELNAPDATITLDDYSFTFDKPLAAGHRTIRVRNVATQAHELFVMRLAPGKTVKDVMAWIATQDGPPPGTPMGGTTGIPQNGSNDIVVDVTAGEYALLCFYPDAKDGQEHVKHGMFKQISVK
ncbi:hypothetical protein [Gemmatirosa kalamazoonensis]|uniref:hypothetical protein n=1 Tax=Gemmatirosa kalamazoonensis TaxID=861299 RepID=UPI00046CE4F4|nr:hypothetical protein [Gemmatirosa kalamazoonensis]